VRRSLWLDFRSALTPSSRRKTRVLAVRPALVARADQQQRWVMQGDPRATYGE